MLNQNVFWTILLAMAVMALPAAAVTILDENFNGVTPPALPTGWAGDNGAGRTTVTEIDSSDLFNQGTSNQYLRMEDDTQGANYQGYVNFSIDAGDVFTLRFLAVELQASGGDRNNGGFGLADGSLTSSSNRAVTFSDATFAADRGELFEVFFLVNNSVSSQVFFNPVTNSLDSLAAGDTTVFAYNYVDLDYTEIATTSGSPALVDVDRFGYTVASSNEGRMNIDDVRTFNGLVSQIPEPASVVLLGLGGLCLLRRQSRHR